MENEEVKDSRDHEMYIHREFKNWSDEALGRRYLMTSHRCWEICVSWPLRNESQQSSDPSEPVESLSDSFTDRESPLSPEPSLMGDHDSPQSPAPSEPVESLSDSFTDRESPLSPEPSDESEDEVVYGTPPHI